MRNIIRLCAALGLLLLLATPVLAQGQLFFRDDAGKLDQGQVNTAAAPLISRGARVAVYTANNGDATTFREYLTNDGLANGGQVRNNLIAIFIGFGNSYSAIRYGNDYANALGANNRYEQIRTNDLNSQLREGNPTQGVVDALESINTAIGAPGSGSSGSGGVTTPASGGGSGLVWLLGGGAVAVGGGALAYNALRKRQGTQQTARSAREAYEQARKQAGAAIADAAATFQDAREKAQYDKVSYPAADLEQITAQQQQAEATYNQAQERFATVEDAFRGKTPAPQEYEQATATYNQVVELVNQATEQLAPANARRAELDKINAAAPEAIARAKQSLGAVAEQAAALGDFRNPRAVTREVDAQVAQAEQLLRDRQGGAAAQAAQAAESGAQALAQVVGRFGTLRETISNGRADAQQVANQGYNIEAGIAAFDQAEAALEQAATALETQGSKAAITLLDQAEALAQEGVGRGGGMPALQRENESRFSQIERAGNQLPAYIEQGRAAFDAVDEYAPSTWNDIRGNGSEAEAAAGRAKTLWERARSRNTREAQDFYGAKQDLNAAEADIARARTLIDSILQRQKDLQAAQTAARKELSMAQADIERGWQFVRSNTADIGAKPEDTLRQAEELLRQANTEAGQPKPDWIALVRQAQEANRLADEALEAAQGEFTEMGKLREQVNTARQLALGETQRLIQFAQLHPNDLSPQSAAGVQQVQQQVQQAERIAANAEQTEEEARARSLRDAQQRYAAVAESAGQVYQQAYSEFQSVEQVRGQVNAEAQRAALAIQQAERSMQMFSAYIPRNSEGIQLMERAQALMNSIGTVRTEQEAQQAIANAQEAQRNAESADRLFRSYGNMGQPGGYARGGGGVGDFVGGMIIGSMLGGGGGHGGGHGGGSGWGGSWGGSGGGGGDGGWGGGGGGGGSWGGGGGDGGGGGW